jgi:UDP-glucose 4-epimerase
VDSGLDVVTGGAGFIGSHLVEALLAKGRKVRIADDFSSGSRANVPEGAEILEGDVVETATEAVRGADVIYHLAAIPSVPRSILEPLESHRATAESTLALLVAGELAGVRRLVLASSSAIYGNGPGLPRREEQKPDPRSPYALAKLVSELYAEHWARYRTLETVTLRLFNVYGPGQSPDSPYSAAVAIFLQRLFEGRQVPVFGGGTQTRDFIYVGDVVRGLIAGGTRAGISGRVYNLATGRSVSILQLVQTAAQIFGKSALLDLLPGREADIQDSSGAVDAAKRDLGFVTEVSLEEGLRQTVLGISDYRVQ